MTTAQRRVVAEHALKWPIEEPSFDDGASRVQLECRAVFWARVAASRLRSAAGIVETSRGALETLVAAAEAYQAAIERVAPPRVARPGIVLP